MLKKDFFVLLIKLFGLYSMIIVLFNILPQSFNYVSSYGADYMMIILAVVMSLLTIALFYLLLFSAPKIVSLLKLEKGFECEKFDFLGFSSETIIKLSSIIIGGITVIDNLPSLISYTLYAFSSTNSGQVMEANEKFYWVSTLVQILVGLFLVFNFEKVAKLLNRNAQPNTK